MSIWDDYSEEFETAARNSNLSTTYLLSCLTYAKGLFNRNLPVIYDLDHFSKLVGYDSKFIIAAAYSTDSFYRQYSVPKIAGGARLISEPLPSLKEIQRWILDNLLHKIRPSRFAKGFVLGRSIKDNARFHRGQAKVLSLDIKDFFPNVRPGRVFNLFRSLGYQRRLAFYLTRICTLDGSLPQGAPTSPALSNLVSIRIDRRLGGFALKQGIRYTRYADDLSFSGDFDVGGVITFAKKVVSEEGFRLNESKIRLMERHQRQEVTGVVVNTRLQAPASLRKKFRTEMYFIRRFGIESHMKYARIEKANYLKHLMGIANFILFVNPEDKMARSNLVVLQRIYEEWTNG
jgi:RNA-directed DNA polymerase